MNPETCENSFDAESLEAAHSPSHKTQRDPSASRTIHVLLCSYACFGAFSRSSSSALKKTTYQLFSTSPRSWEHGKAHFPAMQASPKFSRIIHSSTKNRADIPAAGLSWSSHHSEEHLKSNNFLYCSMGTQGALNHYEAI